MGAADDGPHLRGRRAHPPVDGGGVERGDGARCGRTARRASPAPSGSPAHAPARAAAGSRTGQPRLEDEVQAVDVADAQGARHQPGPRTEPRDRGAARRAPRPGGRAAAALPAAGGLEQRGAAGVVASTAKTLVSPRPSNGSPSRHPAACGPASRASAAGAARRARARDRRPASGPNVGRGTLRSIRAGYGRIIPGLRGHPGRRSHSHAGALGYDHRRSTGERRATEVDGSDAARPGPRRTVLRTQLVAPPPRPHALPRASLTDRLGAVSAPGRLTLVVAERGGARRRWWRRGSGPSPVPAAWFSVDATDSDPVRFWGGVVAALDGVVPGLTGRSVSCSARPAPRPRPTWCRRCSTSSPRSTRPSPSSSTTTTWPTPPRCTAASRSSSPTCRPRCAWCS